MTRSLSRAAALLAIVVAVGLAGCQESLVEPAPDVLDPDAPITEAEFKKQMAENGVVVLQPKDYAAFGISDASVTPEDATARKSADCTSDSDSSGDYLWSVCSEFTEETQYNAPYFRVTIDAQIASTRLICEDNRITSCEQAFVAVTSSTVRGDGTVLQDNVFDSGNGNAATSFVAFYPQSDNFTFNHTSDFSPVNATITKTVTPN